MPTENAPSLKEMGLADRVPVPVYSPKDQIHVSPTAKAEHFRTPAMDAIVKERLRASSEIAKMTGNNVLSNDGLGLEWAIDHTNPVVGSHFDTHGFSKETARGLNNLDDILTDGIQPDRELFSMGFVRAGSEAAAIGAMIPFEQGGIYLISDYDNSLAGPNGGIRFVGVGGSYVRAIDQMQVQWPQVQFVPWHDLPKVLTERANQVTGNNLPYQTLTNKNQPFYGNRLRYLATPEEPEQAPQMPDYSKIQNEVDPSKVF